MNNINIDAIDRVDDFYMRNKDVFRKQTKITVILIALFLILLVVIGIRLNALRPNSQKVNVHVESVKRGNPGNDVYVIYENNRYELINVRDSEIYKYKACCETGH